MTSINEINPIKPDAVSMAEGKIYLDALNKRAYMEGKYEGRLIRVEVHYDNDTFTEDQARNDFNKSLKKIARYGKNNLKDIYHPSENVTVYFGTFVQPWEKNTDEITTIKAPKNVSKIKKAAEEEKAKDNAHTDKAAPKTKWTFPERKR